MSSMLFRASARHARSSRVLRSVRFYSAPAEAKEEPPVNNIVLSMAEVLAAKEAVNPSKATWLDALREREKMLAQGKTIDSYSFNDPKTYAVGEKTRQDSFSFVSLPFKDNKWLCDAYINAFGRLRVGQLFQDLDALAGRIAHRHCSPAEPMNVTASVDRVYMVRKVDEISNYNFVLAGVCTWTGRSSMEITVKGYAFDGPLPENITEESLAQENVFLTAGFTFVARDPTTHKSFAVNRLLPITEKEWTDYRRAESSAAKKRLAAKTQSIIEPTEMESQLIYNMWRSTKAMIQSGKPVPKSTQFMKDTKMSSTLMMQPQYRNRHSYMIFGGYLLRQSFELAYVCAGDFASAPPRFVSLDSTTFKNPVPVGSVLSMDASIAYTEHLHDISIEGVGPSDSPFDFKLPAVNKIADNPNAFLSEPGTLVQVKVDTKIKPLDGDKSKDAGTFIFSFFVPKSEETSFGSVIPQSYSEMMTYIEGRRRALDTAQYVDTLPRHDEHIGWHDRSEC
ncbi:hypothetical protein DICA3_F21990 [Diutina catenulata]